MARNPTILITGGAGFIGSHLTDRLTSKGYKTYVIDNLSTGIKSNINKKAIFVEDDITKIHIKPLLNKIKPSIIYHFAAQSSLQKSLDDPLKDMNINLVSTIRILSSVVTLPTLPTFIFASSAAVYSDGNKLPHTENSLTKPQIPYGISKLACEYYINFYGRKYNMPYSVLRFSNVYGPRQISTSEGGVIAIFTNNALMQKPITIFNSGNQTRDFIYVDDVVDACIKAGKCNLSGTYNISTVKGTSINMLTDHLAYISGHTLNIVKAKRELYEVKHSLLANKKARKVLKWTPRTQLKSGLEKIFMYKKTS